MAETPDRDPEDPDGDDDESVPPHFNETFESEPDEGEEGEDDGED